MKRLLLTAVLTASMLAAGISTAAAKDEKTISIDETEYSYTVDSDGVTIEKAETQTSNLTIPSEIEDTAVIGIGKNAFSGCVSLESITLPQSLTYISGTAFMGCTSLETITIPENVVTIGERAFYGCESLTTVKLPSGLKKLGSRVFVGCRSLKKINIPAGVIDAFSEDNFKGVQSLSDVTVEGAITSRLASALRAAGWRGTSEWNIVDGVLIKYNGSGGNVIIPDTVTEIGDMAFGGSDIASVVIPSTVTRIGQGAFYMQERLKSVTIPGSVRTIDMLSFSNCTALEKVVFEYSEYALSLGGSSFQFTAVMPEDVITNGRNVLNIPTAFTNTALDPEYSGYIDPKATSAPVTMTSSEQDGKTVLKASPAGFTFTPEGFGNAVIKKDGALYTWELNGTDCWGYDDTVSTGDDLRKDLESCIAVDGGLEHTLALKNDGTLWGWGFNDHYQLMNQGTRYLYKPAMLMEDVKLIAAGNQASYAVKTDGSLWSWGCNADGELGNGRTQERTAEPQRIMDNVKYISAGGGFAAAIKNDDSLWMWGTNYKGNLGDGTDAYRAKPVKIMENVAAVDLGEFHTMILKKDGTVWTCGLNSYGQIGNGKTTDSSKPVKVLDDVVAVSAGNGVSAVIKSDNSLWMWGIYRFGSIPADESMCKINEDDVPYIGKPVKVMDNVKAVYAGLTTFVLKADDTLWGWGSQFADITDVQRYIPEDYANANIPVMITGEVMPPSGGRAADERKPGTITVKSGDTIAVYLGEEEIIFPDAQPFVDENGRTQIPIRAVAEVLGAKVDWDGTEQIAAITKDNKVIIIAIGNTDMQVGREVVEMDTAAEIIDERTYIPVRFVGEALGMTVNWTGGER